MDKRGKKMAPQQECGSSHETPTPLSCKASPGSVCEGFRDSHGEGDISQHFSTFHPATGRSHTFSLPSADEGTAKLRKEKV